MEEQNISDNSKFVVNRTLIKTVERNDQPLELQDLDIAVYDQSILEKGILDQVEGVLNENEEKGGEESKLRDILSGRLEKTAEDSNRNLCVAESELEEGEIQCENNSGTSDIPPEKTVLTEIEKYLQKQLELSSSKKSSNQKKPTKTLVSRYRKLPKEFPHPRPSSPPIKRAKRQPSKLSPKKKRKKEKLGTKIRKQKTDEQPGDQPGEVTLINFDDPSESEYEPSSDDFDEEYGSSPRKKKPAKRQRQEYSRVDTDDSDWLSSEDEDTIKNRKKELDDGDLNVFMRRTKKLEKSDRDKVKKDFKTIEYNFKVPLSIWDRLFDYQQKGVQWFWDLHKNNCGGILGDEMGLGKTIQTISFLAGLHFSDERDYDHNFCGLGPSLIVCPTTIMHQWVREFHHWYPCLRVAILHESGTFSGKDKVNLIKSVHSKTVGVLITSYSGLLQYKNTITSLPWHYVILDEGHKIRNPDAQVTIVAKELLTSHRLILSGSPMQNNLKELWSLFDFIVPGKLGTLNIFTASFVVPILQGGYVNASKTQVLTAYKCASALRDVINPFLLRRSKAEVNINLPGKTEQVLFCKLTDSQREIYKGYLDLVDLSDFWGSKAKLFSALTVLRKVCNHPDLYTGGPKRDFTLSEEPLDGSKGSEQEFGYWKRSGKMIVLVTLLQHWAKSNDRVLLFTQGKKMLLLLENFVRRTGYKYLKLDGGTSISARQPMIDKFNNDTSYFIMLLTTRVGGLGVNLTGANKVVIFDPDWNPATDTQARERAWRIGQSKEVTIFRFITAGTIEEKMYHRQIFKQFLSNKVLKDPKQRRFFKSNDLMELLSLNETVKGGTNETAAIFAGTGSEIKYDPSALKKPVSTSKQTELPKIHFSEEKIKEMKRIAQEMSKKLAKLAQSKGNGDRGEINCDEMYGPDGSLKHKPEQVTKNEENNNSFKKGVVEGIEVSQQEKEPLNGSNKLGQDPKEISDAKKNPASSDLGYGLPSTSKAAESQSEFLSRSTIENKKSKKKAKEKNKKKGVGLFEGKAVPHLVKCKSVKKKKKPDEETQDTVSQDEYILHKLFKNSGIQTAMKHDSIMGDGPQDYEIVEEEASRVAKEAIKAVKESSRALSANPPIQECTNDLTREILNKIKERKLQGLTASPNVRSLLLGMITWLNSHGGTASTDMLVQEFRNKVETSKSPIFKSLLENIATFFRGPDKVGYWTIKNEFR